VYDVSGRVVRSLVSKQQPAGTFTEIWNALDDGGTRVPSGVYFVRFRFDNIIKTRKIVLLN
jgi:flagellar hook assembly protein FlgD